MRVREIEPGDLTDDLVHRWEALRAGNGALVSPFFASEFVRLLGEVRDDLRIGIVEKGGTPVAFLPFHRARFRTGNASGWPLADYHGLIAQPDLELDPREVLQSLGLNRLRFYYVPRAQPWFAPYVSHTDRSPILRVAGFRASSNDRRKLRKLEREVGPVEFTASAEGGEDVDQLIAWKQAQIDRTGFHLLFAHPWLTPLLRRLPRSAGENFAGMFTTLRAGGRLIAAHLGLRSDKAWHWWFPVYDPAFGAYSPGLLMIILMAGAAPELGVQWIDFGPGPEAFKRRLANDHIAITRGTVTTGPLIAGFTQAERIVAGGLRRSGLHRRLQQLQVAMQPSTT